MRARLRESEASAADLRTACRSSKSNAEEEMVSTSVTAGLPREMGGDFRTSHELPSQSCRGGHQH